MARYNLINSVLCCLNPRMQVTPTHFVCGKELAIFTSIAQIENCLTSLTNKCKCLNPVKPNCLRSDDNTKN